MPVRRRRTTALAAAVATAAALGATALATAGATTASAAEVPLKDYELTWGIKQSYRTYVATFAKGGFTPADGATQAADNGAFTFVDGTGTYESTANTVDLAFKGSLAIESTAHGFALTLSDVRFDSEDAEITADVTRGGTTEDDVPLATVAVTREMKDMATTLTEEAAEAFGSASYGGAAGDPLTVTRKTPPEPSPTPTTQDPTTGPTTGPTADPSPTATRTQPEDPKDPEPTATGTTSSEPSPTASAGTGASPSATTPSTPATEVPAKGEIADGTLGWGVKESFRTYVVDGYAKGKITVSGGAVQAAGNGAFTFKNATGTYDTDADRLTASFQGAVNFKGHETNGTYGLDLTLSNLKATLDGGTGKLVADVNSLGTRTEGVALADLKAGSADLTARNDVITVDGVAATLTGAGAKIFGNYQAGTALDAVDLSVALSDDAQLPDGNGNGNGSGTSGGTGGTGGVSGSTTGGTGSIIGGTGSTTGGALGGGSLASTGADIPGPALGAAAGVAVAIGAGAVFAARKRRTRA
ncbi:HtaA domain-containing protein [Streptomyces sp. DH41]|uniref:HtaA domain-containing protein n=1 Tax=Streptomyces sp. DH41 TaxID=3040125 RepID=UPI0024432A6A|nr:HtaA domain-containing protein [Streptomyces sp. DH41]MDG9725789.1 HtaA domain-containing protein [Streptomyces sp. DH41]